MSEMDKEIIISISFGWIPHRIKSIIKVNLNTKIGLFVQKLIPHFYTQNIFITCLSVIFEEKDTKYIKYIGYDYDLNKTCNDYPELRQDFTIKCYNDISWSFHKYSIDVPLFHFSKNKKFPPTSLDDWNKGEPLNEGKYLIWKGYGCGPTAVSPEIDNRYEHLALLKFPEISNSFKKIVNIINYYKLIQEKKGECPLTKRKLSSDTKIKIKAFSVICIKRTKIEHRNKYLMPEISVKYE